MKNEFLNEVLEEVDSSVSQQTVLDLGAVDALRFIEANFQPRVEVAARLDNVAAGGSETSGYLGRREGI